ncbi:adenosylcobinamide-phosphate synthase CbiB [Dyadobacter sp. CY347]|uniref:adenosylcobinamide-phosphate synthase CbiB n=1 Tax=Dyadobacter sp. CY347 TaxID=2909336 RepID=UPI001F348B2C|nr:adenosylcobinamide-phosphate synthase CbiB [Dyadobacter sp. CY347]MCF2487551.1 adenosylcobinamide-phosphate synthase CbiB [Dyadobacter sp. CY347]
MDQAALLIIPLLAGYALDLWLGDPETWPHPVKVFGNLIAWGEKRLNKGSFRFFKGAMLTVFLVGGTFIIFYVIRALLADAAAAHSWQIIAFNTIFVWYGLANRTLIKEGKAVFEQLSKNGLPAGRIQLSRIVGRDTSNLTQNQVRIAVLETMSENLSDGVVAPLFYYMLGGIPGMMTYKMINTLDSMIGYRSERYEQFGKFAARLDDLANLIPARLTAFLMVLVTFSGRGLDHILRFGNKHKSPNAGYPEAALAGILHCRFGGPNVYHGMLVEKPYVGENEREIEDKEIVFVSRINHLVCLSMVAICCFWFVLKNL